MESKSINRFHSYCKSLDNLHRSVSANPEESFVLEATVQMFCLTFDLSWKVMKDILIRVSVTSVKKQPKSLLRIRIL